MAKKVAKKTGSKPAAAKPAAAKSAVTKSIKAKPAAVKKTSPKPAAAAPVKAAAKTKSAIGKASGKTVDWSYLRANCKTCEKAEAWLGQAGVGIGPRVDARKQTIGAVEGLKLAKGVSEVRAAKGTAVAKLDMKKGAPSDAELGKLIIGPTGNLRAPTLRHGNTLVVGFNDQLYSEFFQG